MPVEALLTVNGWPEICDGLGSEDYCLGMALENNGFPLVYDRRMLTLESEEAHFEEPPLRKDDWHFEGGKPVRGGNGGNDKSHAVLNIALQSKRFENYNDFRALRAAILNGEDFTVMQIPEHDWYTKLPLKDL